MTHRLPPSEYTGEKLCLCCGEGFESGNSYAVCAEVATDGTRYTHDESCRTYDYEHTRLCDSCEAPPSPNGDTPDVE